MRTQVSHLDSTFFSTVKKCDMSKLLATALLLFTIGIGQVMADIIYATDATETPTAPATVAIEKGEFHAGAVSWADGYSNYFQTTSSSGTLTLTFSPALDLSASADAKITVYWGTTSNRPLNLTINGGSAVKIDEVADKNDRSVVRAAEASLTETSLSSIKFSSSGGSGVYIFRIEISGESAGPDATLSSLLVNGESLSGFSPSNYDYKLSLVLPTDDNGNFEWPVLTATTSDENASFEQSSSLLAEGQMQYVFTVTNEEATKVYTIVITAKPEGVEFSHEAHLAEIRVDGTPLSDFDSNKFSYYIELEAEAEGKITCTPLEASANVSIQAGSPASDGTTQYTIVVMAEDGETSLQYQVTIAREQPVQPPVEVPTTNLSIHYPGIYETLTTFGGYGGTLTEMNGREYEVYYLARVKINDNNCATVSISPTASTGTLASTNETDRSFDSKDGWFYGRANNAHSSFDDQTQYQEFAGAYIKYKMVAGDSIVLHISGYDQFRFLAKDNKIDTSKPQNNRIFTVYIDGVLQESQASTSISVRSYNITSGEHVISIGAIGTSNCEAYGWSLRLSTDPRVSRISGNDSTQVINQTQQIAPIKYGIKNFVTSNFKWNGNSVPGITMKPLNDKGDTIQISGIADAAAGQYSYTIEAIDAKGNITSTMSGSFTIKTELKADTTNATFWITDASSLPFTYYALDAKSIHLTWTDKKPAGLSGSTIDERTYAIQGTPTSAGTFPYTLSIDGGNTLTGTIIVDIPSPIFTEPEYMEAHGKAGTRIRDIVWGVRFASTATVTGLPEGLTGTYSNGKFTISGTPALLTYYPQTFSYVITATPEYTGKASTTAKGSIVIIDPSAKSLLYLYKDNSSLSDDNIYKYLNNRFDLSARAADDHLRSANDYNYYNVIVISENVDADNQEALDIIRKLNKPVLNMNAFTYSSTRLNWGFPNNGSVVNRALEVIQPEHPIFSENASTSQFTIGLFIDSVDIRGIQPVEVTLKNTLCLAAAPIRGRDYYTSGELQTAIHEVPGNLRGNGITARYLLLPISQRSAKYINANTQRLISACIDYLVDNKTGYTMTLPTLQILSFSVAGVEATIDENKKTIRCVVPDGTDLTSVIPQITLADKTTHTNPLQDTPIDLSDSRYGREIIVSDYINTVTYNVICTTKSGLEENTLSGVYYDAASQTLQNAEGHTLYIYDVMGKLVGVTNTTISLSNLPHGLYLIQSQDAVKKIMR